MKSQVKHPPVQPLPSPSPHEQEPETQQDGRSRNPDNDKHTNDRSGIIEERAGAPARVATAIVQASAWVPDDLRDGIEDSVGIGLHDSRGDGSRRGCDELASAVSGRHKDSVRDFGRYDTRGNASRQSECARGEKLSEISQDLDMIRRTDVNSPSPTGRSARNLTGRYGHDLGAPRRSARSHLGDDHRRLRDRNRGDLFLS
jgi:hypothetical protein